MGYAKRLIINMESDDVSIIRLKYLIDDQFNDNLSIHLPRAVPLTKTHLSLLGLVGSFVIAQLCLAETVYLDFPCSKEMVESGLPMLGLLYNCRCYRDRIPLLPLPELTLLQEQALPELHKSEDVMDQQHAYLTWSGGKDSTLSLMLLQANGYKVSTFYATANTHTVSTELESVANLGNLFGNSVELIEMNPQSLTEVGRAYSNEFDRFPEASAIPEGREFLLSALLATLAYFDDACTICSGSEFEPYSMSTVYDGSVIYKTDAQSERGYQLLTEYLRRWYGSNFIAFSPIAPLTEFRVFKILLEKVPAAFQYLTSCMWDRWCGQCFKCLRYSLMQGALGSDVLKFQVSPLEENPFLQRYLDNWEDTALPSWKTIHYCLSVLSQCRESASIAQVLRRYRQWILPHVADSLAGIYKDYLIKTHPVELKPDKFDATLLG